MGPDTIFAAKILPRLGCFVQVEGCLGESLAKISAPTDGGIRQMSIWTDP